MMIHTRPLVQKLNQVVLDLIFPPNCVSCKTAGSWLCQTCLTKIAFITPETVICERCGTPTRERGPKNNLRPDFCRQCDSHPLESLDGLRAAARFQDNPVRSAIHFLKYNNHRAVAATLAGLLATAYRSSTPFKAGVKVDVIVPVPLHPARLKERGYNQSELLARQLSALVDLSVNTGTLRRVRQTKAQVELDAAERRQNVANAFACDDSLSGQSILLIDDVCTTGSTLDSCAKALKAGGAASVWALTLARAG